MPKRNTEESTLHDRIATVMGAATMNIKEVLQALEDAGEPAKSRASVNKALTRAMTIIDGEKVKKFARAARGRYRVASADDAAADQPATRRKKASKVQTAAALNGHTPAEGGHAPVVYTQESTSGALRAEDYAELRKMILEYGKRAVRRVLEEIA